MSYKFLLDSKLALYFPRIYSLCHEIFDSADYRACLVFLITPAFGIVERDLKIETKFYPTKGKCMGWFYEDITHSPADLRKTLKVSLAALKTEKFYMLHLHAPDQSVPFEDTLRESWEVAQIYEICKRNGWVIPTVYRGLYNAYHRVVEAEFVPCLRAYGISLYVYNPLALTCSIERHCGGSRTHSALSKELGDAVVVGTSSTKHLEDNLEALEKGPLPADVVEALDAGYCRSITGNRGCIPY
ncbi:NADP-dependent oxidoreductase domain-containing protein [Mycena epipterygia]|nr:NADP-dependent oxidoreductase domain-containing protein [Mycena epipterygia]